MAKTLLAFGASLNFLEGCSETTIGADHMRSVLGDADYAIYELASLPGKDAKTAKQTIIDSANGSLNKKAPITQQELRDTTQELVDALGKTGWFDFQLDKEIAGWGLPCQRARLTPALP